jgi:DNA-binding CsgD family transcriptional regulator
MISADKIERTQAAIERLVRAGLDAETFGREVIACLHRVVPFEGWCWGAVDPATLLPSWCVAETTPLSSCQQRFWELELQTADVNQHRALARSPLHVGILSGATGGDLARSPRWAELLRPGGMRDELRVALVLGELCWGSLALYRERSSGCFTPSEGRLLERLVLPLARGLRAALVQEAPRFDDAVERPGLLILGPDLKRVASTPQGDRWLARLGPADRRVTHPAAYPTPGQLPAQVYALMAHLTALEASSAPNELAPRTRLRIGDGRWLILQAERLAGTGSRSQVAVVLQPARPADLAPLLVHGYNLSARERAVAEHALQGRSTAQIAIGLGITPYTVRDHLKAIFDKVGVRSRRELGQVLAARVESLAVG